MIVRIDHVAIAVNEYDNAVHFFKDILGAIPGVGAGDDRLKFFWQLFSLGDLSRLEILKPTGNGSFLDSFLKEKKSGGVHHITMQTLDIQAAMKILDENKIPYFGFADLGDAWKEVFIHPRDAFGVLIQIAQFRPDDWLNDTVKFPPGQKWSVAKTRAGGMLSVANPGGGKMNIEFTKEEIKQLINDLSGLCLE